MRRLVRRLLTAVRRCRSPRQLHRERTNRIPTHEPEQARALLLRYLRDREAGRGFSTRRGPTERADGLGSADRENPGSPARQGRALAAPSDREQEPGLNVSRHGKVERFCWRPTLILCRRAPQVRPTPATGRASEADVGGPRLRFCRNLVDLSTISSLCRVLRQSAYEAETAAPCHALTMSSSGCCQLYALVDSTWMRGRMWVSGRGNHQLASPISVIAAGVRRRPRRSRAGRVGVSIGAQAGTTSPSHRGSTLARPPAHPPHLRGVDIWAFMISSSTGTHHCHPLSISLCRRSGLDEGVANVVGSWLVP